MKFTSPLYLIIPLLAGCIPDNQDKPLFTFDLADPVEESHGLKTTAEKSLHCYKVFKISSDSYELLAETKANNKNIQGLADDQLKIALDFKRFYEKSKIGNEKILQIDIQNNLHNLTTECLTYGETFGYAPWN